ncbi:hypothetical protein SAMN05216353_102182 [Halobacillus alkaliphilus]|uniref:Uncharacterized protein n=1 Tax=Halobacillus alkaliphilus TaxID=396056 RepID=A0A1I2K041_9BACI|nr:hypothetical protein [Halobacillus alkaliphilus]SFF58471.1 hypothetical protein SAMN05216353_102182 [Halobacillus alkaliphilus]
MEFFNAQSLIFDNNLIIAIIAINMTIIGLTSLAETKRIIGVDYGKFLVKRYRAFNRIRIYNILIGFALINVSSLFLMAVKTMEFRLINSLLLMISLGFAMYYFFAYIISENKLVRKQIYEDELQNLYYSSDSYDHQEADVLTDMSGGSRTNKKLSSNVINYFITYNSESQSAFADIFGPSSLLYDYSNKNIKKWKRKYSTFPYKYRKHSNGMFDISYEYFQLFRSSEHQDRWTLEILRLFDGDRRVNDCHDLLRFYNFTRVVTHLNLFGSNENIYRYKFLEYLTVFYYQAVAITYEEVQSLDREKLIEVEEYTFNELIDFFYHDEHNQRDSAFFKSADRIMREMILHNKYKGMLSEERLLFLFLEKSLERDSSKMQEVFTSILEEYHIHQDENEIPDNLKYNSVKQYIAAYRKPKDAGYGLTREDLFEGKFVTTQ